MNLPPTIRDSLGYLQTKVQSGSKHYSTEEHIGQRFVVLTLRWTGMNLKFYSVSLVWHIFLRCFDAKLRKNSD